MDFARRLEPAQLDVARVVTHGVADELRTLGLSLRLDHRRPALLLRLVHDEPRPLRLLLRHLLRLDGRGVLLAEGEVRNGHVVQDEVELSGALQKHRANLARDCLAHRDQLRGIVLRDDGFENLVHDRRQDALVVVGA